MKRLLLPLLASLALPAAANAENYTLILIAIGGNSSNNLEEINNVSFLTKEKCETEGKKFSDRSGFWNYHCVEH